MGALVGALGMLQIAGGVLVYTVGKSSNHEILGAILFGMGVIALGVGVLIEKTDKQLAIFAQLGKPKA